MRYTLAQVEQRFGTTTNQLADAFYRARPKWISGYVGHRDARFLYRCVVESGADLVLEVGTASGLSTALIAHALATANGAGLIGPNYRVKSYDISDRFYADKTYRTGDAAREQLDSDLMSHVEFRNPATAHDAAAEHPPESVEVAFIDANHEHPWPTLDLLALLPCLAPGAIVLLHDINLPIVNPTYHDVVGAKVLFDDLGLPSRVPDDPETPNIGAVIMDAPQSVIRERLLRVLDAHPWQRQVSASHLQKLGLEPRDLK